MRLRRQAPDSVVVLTRGDAPGEPRALCRRELAAQACGMSCTESGQHFSCVSKTLPSASSRSFTLPGCRVAPGSHQPVMELLSHTMYFPSFLSFSDELVL